MGVAPAQVTWLVAWKAQADVRRVRLRLGEEAYRENLGELQSFLCNYFSSGEPCVTKQENSISPLGASPAGGKKLKVRWALPGDGKSGGLRLALLAQCEARRVIVAAMFPRADDPGDEEFDGAFVAAADEE